MKLLPFLLLWCATLVAAKGTKSLRGSGGVNNKLFSISKERELILDNDKSGDDVEYDLESNEEDYSGSKDEEESGDEDYDEEGSTDFDSEDLNYEDSLDEEADETASESHKSSQMSLDRSSDEDEESGEVVYDDSEGLPSGDGSGDASYQDMEMVTSENLIGSDDEESSDSSYDDISQDTIQLLREDEDYDIDEESNDESYDGSSQEMKNHMREDSDDEESTDENSYDDMDSYDKVLSDLLTGDEEDYSLDSSEESIERSYNEDEEFNWNDTNKRVDVRYRTGVIIKETETFGGDIGVEQYISSTLEVAKARNQSWIFIAVAFQLTMFYVVIRNRRGSGKDHVG